MSVDLNEMRLKALLILDEESGYTEHDFNQEFGNSFNQSNVYDIGLDDYKIKLSFVNESDNEDPQYATDGSSGFDLRANLNEKLIIKPSEYTLIKTGLYFDIPDNMEITIRSRSGLAYKHGVCVLNGIGTIDSDYTGEIGVLLINHGKEDFIINNGDRIAQAVLTSVLGKNIVKFVKESEINKITSRGNGGYGSSGIK